MNKVSGLQLEALFEGRLQQGCFRFDFCKIFLSNSFMDHFQTTTSVLRLSHVIFFLDVYISNFLCLIYSFIFTKFFLNFYSKKHAKSPVIFIFAVYFCRLHYKYTPILNTEWRWLTLLETERQSKQGFYTTAHNHK